MDLQSELDVPLFLKIFDLCPFQQEKIAKNDSKLDFEYKSIPKFNQMQK